MGLPKPAGKAYDELCLPVLLPLAGEGLFLLAVTLGSSKIRLDGCV